MAAGVATRLQSSSDVGARLRADQAAERRRRQAPRGRNIPGLQTARNAMLALSMLGTAPEQPETNQESAPQAQSLTAGEDYQRKFRARQLQHQMGPSVDSVLDRQGREEDLSEVEKIQQDYSQRLSEAQQRNQLGLDKRQTSAKRAEQKAITSEGLNEGMKAAQDAIQKEIGSLGVNLFSDAVEGIDAPGEDLYLSQGVVFVQRNLQVSRTILSPAPPSVNEIGSLEDLKTQAIEKSLDAVIPRLDLRTPGGISGLLGVAFQWSIFPLFVLLVAILVMIGMALYEFSENPLLTLWNISSYVFSSVLNGTDPNTLDGMLDGVISQ